MENWIKAIELQQFIKGYIPKGWREAIGVCTYAPSVSEENYIFFELAHKSNNLVYAIANYSEPLYEKYFGEKLHRFNKPYIIEAIQEYFNKGIKPSQFK